jgi:hypothetical protein
MKDIRIWFVIQDPILKVFYKTSKINKLGRGFHEYTNFIKDANIFDSRKQANDYIKQWLDNPSLKVKKLKITYEIND